MALFQVSVLNTYLKLQEEQKLANAFKKFSKYFHNPVIQENIRNSKEEQFQATFLTELFVNVLGYTLNPQPDFNLSTEFKNENNARKADGAILKDGAAIGVIELKGTNTKDLEGIRKQAFDYKVNQKSCVYVITSNFEKLRFYINDATEFIEFDLFLLTAKDFALLYLCLQKENILKNLPLKIKESSVVKEEQITKDFYKDYSVFKRELYRDLVRLNAKTLKNIRLSDPDFSGVEESNPDYAKSQAQLLRLEKNVKLELFKKSQKLIDRFLFIFFAEDRGLLPPNSTIKIVKDWNKLKELDAVVPLYDRFKLYFSYLDQGRKSTGSRAEIFAYNGGLFKPDNLLDRLEINDELLAKHTTQLSKYDFESQVDVNILGHIFENSLNEIESVNAEIEGADFDKQKSKRKKDGVFYTPKYITKYIVENTLGKFCEEKKSELGFREEEYFKGRKRRQKDTLEGLIRILDDYRAWLLQLTICDPACGSGAFLNQALDFLIKEHRYIDELKAKLLGGGLVFSDIETTILENNIYGVDINEESIEIAKLSLWLRTAQPRRKLNNLSSNLKCGNSLIDDKKVAGDKAFRWEEEFKDVFANGGFDVVIGNPPYVKLETIKSSSEALSKMNYSTFEKRGDLYILFVEKGFQILKESGKISFIMPNKWLQAGYGKPLREFFLTQRLTNLIDFGDLQIFEGATTYPCIFIAEKNQPQNEIVISVLNKDMASDFYSNVLENQLVFQQSKFSGGTWVISSNKEKELLEKLNTKNKSLEKLINGQSYRGVLTGFSEAFFVNKDLRSSLIQEDRTAENVLFPFLKGRDLNKWQTPHVTNYLVATFPSFHLNIENHPSIKNHLLNFGKERLEQSGFKGSRKKTNNKWFETQDTIGYWEEFAKPKIMYQVFQVKPNFIYDEQGLYCNNSMWIIPTDSKALVAVLNSKMGWWLISKYCTQIQNGYQLIWNYFKLIPIPELANLNNSLDEKAETMILFNNTLQEQSQKFQRTIQRKFELEQLSKKLQDWYLLTYPEFINELSKKKIKLSLSEEAEWEDYFLQESKKTLVLKTNIDATDKEIDKIVYGLYGLTEDEIEIVEK